jgi:hypothetical protein
MGEITLKVSLYNRAYFLAWQGVPDRTKTWIPNIAAGLDKAIREQIRKGETEATKIAARAVNQIFGPFAYTVFAPPIRHSRRSRQTVSRAGQVILRPPVKISTADV